MKLIDILVMISKGELKEGTKVKCPKNENESVWVFRIRDGYNRLIDEEEHYYLDPVFFINEEVELIEPECISNVGKTSEPTDNTTEKIEEIECPEIYNGITRRIIDKLNEVIRYINKEE